MRPGIGRSRTVTPSLNGRASPTESVASSRNRTPKRKAAVMDSEVGPAEETNINVVVRCRGRNDREVRENSGVVVSTDSIRGSKVDLSMGPSALSNKTYQFDKVFSPAADQGMIFEDVVAPTLDNVLSGFNCTIFAYGQTGTGKTYTMSGDITDIQPTPDAAGIIPRVLHSLFDRLGENENRNESNEYIVKCSFIELYNEELRDLLSVDDAVKLKIFDEANKNGRTSTLVQGMEETHIKSASKGLELLRIGSHKRQVAATKCNDLSSRSHTVFTITVHTKQATEGGEDFVAAGKLNLVDLAGSENIQRSGAENKRATEAGLINKSLLTLGRVINALVDKSSHIPYRESKLTRLLQDSLGGRTKTCIIATLSPAKSNLEETISTLDYAFRAKNIRNKPQINQMVSKKTLLREFTTEIEKLKSELIATRQRNGVYLSQDHYEEITTESESRRILSEEQRDRIETLEVNLRNKVQELFHLTQGLMSLKKDHEQVRVTLDSTQNVLDKTELVLGHARQSIEEEKGLRQAHQETEDRLAAMGVDLIRTLDGTTDDVDQLHSKLRRRSELQSANRIKWADAQMQVAEGTTTVEGRLNDLRGEQQDLMDVLSQRMQSFVTDELRGVHSSQSFLEGKVAAFLESEAEVKTQTTKSRDDMNEVLQEILTLREEVKQKVGEGLNDLSAAAQRISAGIASELEGFHQQLFESYSTLGKEFKTTYDDLIKRLNEQQTENGRLREQLCKANEKFVAASTESQAELMEAVTEERTVAASERATLLSQITHLINSSAATQDARMNGYIESADRRLKDSQEAYRDAQQTYSTDASAWDTNTQSLITASVSRRETIKNKLKADWSAASHQSSKITQNTEAVHSETVRIVEGQMAQMDNQLVALDEILGRVRAQNEHHHEAHTHSLDVLAGNVQDSYKSLGDHFETSYSRTEALNAELGTTTNDFTHTIAKLAEDNEIQQSLRRIRDDITSAQLQEYEPTGETPAKTQYSYPKSLPRTEAHEKLLNRMRGIPEPGSMSPKKSPSKSSPSKRSPLKHFRSSPVKSRSDVSPIKPPVWHDSPPTLAPPQLDLGNIPAVRPATAASNDSTLRDIDVNVAANSAPPTISFDGIEGEIEDEDGADKVSVPSFKKQKTDVISQSQGPESKLPTMRSQRATRQTMEAAGLGLGRENLSVGLVQGGGRRLRSRGSD
ncbi:kinesin-domain-containing protein [Polychaeton citri CBS 116435]|uniref:Kinesin-domain-containing protein n=1 Tax=Polychaeton citri CBS 116435 TaxID=1314669 RepID=A0A9P4Q669_9PEZI|nr:kinesin-domain-containing protein [Polychaeton citri CBS 116435]